MNLSLLLLLFGLLVLACLLLSDDLGDTSDKTPLGLLFLAILRGFLVVCAVASAWTVTALMFSLN